MTANDLGKTFSAIRLYDLFKANGPGIDEPIAMVRDVDGNGSLSQSELFFYSKDHLNSVHALVNNQGKPVQRYSYSAFGQTKVEKTNPSTKLIKNFYAYTSREWEEETGDYFYRSRFFNSTRGSFLSPDPIGFDGGDTNLYGYVKNNPVSMNDPSGRIGVIAVVGLAGLAGGSGAVIGQAIVDGGFCNAGSAFINGAIAGSGAVIMGGAVAAVATAGSVGLLTPIAIKEAWAFLGGMTMLGIDTLLTYSDSLIPQKPCKPQPIPLPISNSIKPKIKKARAMACEAE